VGHVRIGDFRQITRYITRKRYKIDAYFLLKSFRKPYCALSIGDIADDLE